MSLFERSLAKAQRVAVCQSHGLVVAVGHKGNWILCTFWSLRRPNSRSLAVWRLQFPRAEVHMVDVCKGQGFPVLLVLPRPFGHAFFVSIGRLRILGRIAFASNDLCTSKHLLMVSSGFGHPHTVYTQPREGEFVALCSIVCNPCSLPCVVISLDHASLCFMIWSEEDDVTWLVDCKAAALACWVHKTYHVMHWDGGSAYIVYDYCEHKVKRVVGAKSVEVLAEECRFVPWWNTGSLGLPFVGFLSSPKKADLCGFNVCTRERALVFMSSSWYAWLQACAL